MAMTPFAIHTAYNLNSQEHGIAMLEKFMPLSQLVDSNMNKTMEETRN